MNSPENVFANRAEKTSDAICETVRNTWPARSCNLHDGLENLDNLMESVYSVTSNVDRIWESIDRMNFPEHLKETALDYLLIFQKAPRKYNLTKNAQAAIHNILVTFPDGESEETEDIHRCAVRQTLAFINNSEDKVDNEELGEAKDRIIRLLIGMHDVESSR